MVNKEDSQQHPLSPETGKFFRWITIKKVHFLAYLSKEIPYEGKELVLTFCTAVRCTCYDREIILGQVVQKLDFHSIAGGGHIGFAKMAAKLVRSLGSTPDTFLSTKI